MTRRNIHPAAHRHARLLVVTAAVAVVGLLALVGPPRAARAGGVAEHDFVGAQSCRTCHEAEYAIWAKGPHARAMEDLQELERRDQRCIQCHTMAPADVDPELAGVQCEACHGPGRYYAKAFVMRDEVLRSRLLFEVPNEKTCRRCHTDSTPRIRPFSYAEGKEKIRHWQDPPPASGPIPPGPGSGSAP